MSPPLAVILQENLGLSRRPRVVLNAPPESYPKSTPVPTLRTVLDLADDATVIVYPGVVKSQRGLDAVVKALPELPNTHLVLICDATSSGCIELQQQATALGCADRLHTHPYVDPGDVAHLMSDASVGVHPLRHYPNAEIALPTKLFEYLQAGIPCIVSDVQEMARFVRQHRVGTTFVCGDPESFASAMYEIAERGAEMRRAITPELRAECSWSCQEKTLGEAYAEVLDHDIHVADPTESLVLAESPLS